MHIPQKLVDLLGSHDFIYKIGAQDGSPTYLLPARESLYDDLAVDFPMYHRLKAELDSLDKHISRYGSWIYDYTSKLDANLLSQITY